VVGPNDRPTGIRGVGVLMMKSARTGVDWGGELEVLVRRDIGREDQSSK